MRTCAVVETLGSTVALFPPASRRHKGCEAEPWWTCLLSALSTSASLMSYGGESVPCLGILPAVASRALETFGSEGEY
jgi:hypothetical protein